MLPSKLDLNFILQKNQNRNVSLSFFSNLVLFNLFLNDRIVLLEESRKFLCSEILLMSKFKL